MKILALTQGSTEWLAHRATARNASDAPALMGESPYVTRSELVKRRATGIAPDVDAATQRIFDRGHEVEPMLRAYAEGIVGEDFYPVVATSDDGYLSASFDGVSMDESIICEVKQYNADKFACVSRREMPGQDYWQVLQQFAVCDTAQTCIYVVGDGTPDKTAHVMLERKDMEHDIARLRAAWAQFDADVAAYVPEPVAAKPVAAPVEGFGALSLRVEGRVLASNLTEFENNAKAFIARLPKPAELQSDQDFADADVAVKACADAESRIKSAKDAALAQMADVDAVLRSADSICEAIRAARLALEKAVKAEKENRKAEAVAAGVKEVSDHYGKLHRSMGIYAMQMPSTVPQTIGASIKGLKSLESVRAKISAAVANLKVEASEVAEARRASIAVIEANQQHAHLLPDAQQLVASKSADDLSNLIATRVAEHEKREAARIEAQLARIRAEEEAKAKVSQVANTEASHEAIAKTEQAQSPADPFVRWCESTGYPHESADLRAAWDAGFSYGTGQRRAA